MADSLRILILEDNPADAELVQFELQEAGLAFTSKVVMTEDDFVRAIQEFSPDLILSDYDLPKYNGALALAQAKRRRPDTPFILVTGAVTEDRAIDILTQGAKDYVLKNRLNQRLVPAVKRALAEAEEQRARKQAEAELREAHRTLEERVKIRTAELEAEMAAHKKTEESLRDSEERQRLVLQASSIGTFEIDLLMGEGRWNATEFELLGLKPGDVKAAPDTFFRFVHPDDIERLRNEWEKATRSGKLDAEFRIVRADGRECWLAGKGTFIFDCHSDGHDRGTSGKPRRFMGVNFDITRRKKAEEAMAATQRQVQSIIDNTTAVIYALDLEERFLLANTALAELLNSTPEKMIGKRRHDFMPKQDADWHEANDRDVIEAETALEFEEYSQLPDRSITWFTTKFPLRDTQGRIYAVGGISTDVTERKKVEEAVRASEERFRGLFTTMNEGFIICEVLTDGGGRPADFRYLDVNPAGERYFGRPREEIVGHTYREIGGTKADAKWIAMLGNIALTGQPASMERYAPVGGRWVDLHAYSPRPGQFAAVFVDITERKRMTEALRDSEGRFRVLTETSSLAVGVSSSDGKFLYVNKAYEKLFGYTHKELNHLNASEFWRNPEDRRKMIDLVKSKGFLMDYEVELKRKDGTPFWAMLSVNPVEYGGNQAIMASVYDITSRKQAEEALRESEEKYRNLVKYAPAAIYEMDLRGTKFFSVNEVMCNILGYSREELLSMKPTDLLDQEGRSLFKDRIRKKLAGEKIDETIEYHIRRKDGAWIQVAVNLGAYTYTNERPTRVAVVAYDITEQKKAEVSLKESTQQLENANKELESFSYSVSHDLRAPLRAIDGYSRMILQKHGENFDEDSRAKFNVIRDNTRMMGQLIDDLLALSRAGSAELSTVTLDIGAMIREVWKEIEAVNTDRRLTMKLAEIPPCRGDRVLIKQVLVNILTNAVKFTKGRVEALVEAGADNKEGKTVYFIRDNGVGFDMQYHDKLFGVFQRLHSDGEFEGTGVGLAIVQRIINRHGGCIWAEGEVDKGATFHFTLPTPQG